MTTSNTNPNQSHAKLLTGVPGFDGILGGGLPPLSVNIVAGRPGTGKTILVHQILFSHLSQGRKALYLTTLSEPSVKLLRYQQEFSFADPSKMGRDLIYLDIGDVIQESGLEETSNLILENVKKHKPSMVVVDSFKAIHELAENSVEIRKFGFNLAVNLLAWEVTTFLIGEYDQAAIQREPIFAIADTIVLLRYEPVGLHYQRFVDVAKVRGSDYFSGQHPYTITSDGLTVYPRIKTRPAPADYRYNPNRIPSGLAELDEMLGGGLPVGSATMVAGGAGTGKTLLGSHFVEASAARDEPSIIVSFQENPAQLAAISRGFGFNLEELKRRELVTHMYRSPVELQPDIHFSEVQAEVDRTGAKLVLIDSLKDLEIATPDKIRYKDYIYSLVNELKMRGVTVLLTTEIPELFGPFQLSEYGASFIADNVVLLRYVELAGRMSRAINVMKVRGSQHSKEIREFEITGNGVVIREPIRAYTGILTGTPVASEQATLARLPLRARYVVETLRRNGSMDGEQLATTTGLDPQTISLDLSWLQQEGLAAAVLEEGRTVFRAAM